MAPSLNFDLPTESSRQALAEVIKKELQTDDYNCTVHAGSAKGDNYIGVVYRALASRRNRQNGNKKSEDLSVIVKLPPIAEARREQFMARPTFVRESLMYDEYLPLLMKFQKDKGIDLSGGDGFHHVAKCYKTVTDEKNEALFLEDLKLQGFEMLDRFKGVNFDQVKLVMEILGKLHAVSFALKDQRPDLLEPFTKMVDIFQQRGSDSGLSKWFTCMAERCLTTLDEDKDQLVLEKVRELVKEEPFDVLKKVVDGKGAEPYAIVTHGDCWNNNILFKIKDGVSVDARLLDWQLGRYSSPALDLLYYIFGGTTKELRDAHYNDFLRIYHNSLSSHLRRLGSDPEKLFPFAVLEDHLKKFGKFGVLMAMVVLPMFTTENEDTPDLDDMSEKMSSGQDLSAEMFGTNKNVDLYNARMSGVLRDCYRLGYF